jgi:hypothetical protein
MDEESDERQASLWPSLPTVDYMAFRVDDRVVFLHRSEGDEWIDQDGNVWNLDQDD